MARDNQSGQALEPITVLVRYDNEEGEQEDRYTAYHTGGNNAMYVIPEYGSLLFTEIKPTDVPGIYLGISKWTELGNINDADGDVEAIIDVLTNKLHSMTAYEFFAKVLVHVRDDFDYEGAIIPNLLNETESGR